MYRRKRLLAGALTLTAANLFTRILGFVYRIYMSNALGAEGMGLYQLIMPIYGLSWSIACSGITTTVSKIVAAENAKGEGGNMGRVLRQALSISMCLAVAVAAALFFFSGNIVDLFLKDGRIESSLRMLSLAVPCMAAGSCIRGYFYGLQEASVPAVSQVIEQLARMALIYFFGAAFMSQGIEQACLAAVMGIVAGEIIAFVYVLISYLNFRAKNIKPKKATLTQTQVMTMILTMSLPLTLNRVTGSLLGAFENFLIPQSLQMYGMTQVEAISAFGRITGMAMPLIFFPSAFLNALSVALVPAISEAQAVGNKKRVQSLIVKSLVFTSLLGMFAAMVFMTLPYELGFMIYKQDIGRMLFMLGLLCPLWYLNITLSGILNGLGQQMLIFRNSLVSSFINIAGVMFAVPILGIDAFFIGWALSLLIVIVWSLLKIQDQVGAKLPYASWFLKPALAAAAAGLSGNYMFTHLIQPRFDGFTALFLGLVLIGGAYTAFVLLLGCVTPKEIMNLIGRRGKVSPDTTFNVFL